MSPTAARKNKTWRIAATAALALIASTGINAATATPASAAPSSGPNASFAWTGASLTTDNGTAGVPDVGDVVTYSYTATTLSTAPSPLESFTIFGIGYYAHQEGLDIAPGASQSFTLDVTVGPLMLDALGSGPNLLAPLTVTHKVTSQFLPRTATMDAPPVLYTAPTPITVSTEFSMTENHGFETGKLVEGDQVHYVTHVTNTSAATLTITGTGYDSPAGAQTLASGASMDFAGAPVTVTYNDMANAGVAFADASVGWSVGSLSGTVAAPVGTAPTEAIDSSFDSSVAYTVNTAGGAAVALGDAVAGNVIDFKVDATSTANVTLNYFGIALDGSWGTAADAKSTNTGGFLPGTSLPNGTVKAKHLKSSGNGVFAPYALTAADVARGYVDLTTSVQAAPSLALFTASPATYTHTTSERVFLKTFNTKANLAFTDATLNDTNGDGIGQAGESINFTAQFKNKADQDLTIDLAKDKAGSDIASSFGALFTGQTVAVGATLAQSWSYTITAADEARGTIDSGIKAQYTGVVDGASNSKNAWSPTIATGAYVAPASTLDTTATFDDANLDGFPSIGETVHVTVTVNNTGAYALTGLAVTDATGSNVTGLLPAFPASIGAGGSAVETFDYVLTAADFARGSLWYSTDMTADGLATTASSTAVSLNPITFQAYAADLADPFAGQITVCDASGNPTTTVTLLDDYTVVPGTSCTYLGLPAGYRVVAFSTPMLLGKDTFTVTMPAALHVGPHSLALYAPDGTLVGWKAVTAQDPIGFAGSDDDTLANTGADGDELMGLGGDALVLMLLGTAFIVADSRRRKHSSR